MELDVTRGAALYKALADDTRVRIIHILSCGELCACKIQPYFPLSQPTLSHHLTILVDAGLVAARPEGKWVYYSLNEESFSFLDEFTRSISRGTDACQCGKNEGTCNV